MLHTSTLKHHTIFRILLLVWQALSLQCCVWRGITQMYHMTRSQKMYHQHKILFFFSLLILPNLFQFPHWFFTPIFIITPFISFISQSLIFLKQHKFFAITFTSHFNLQFLYPPPPLPISHPSPTPFPPLSHLSPTPSHPPLPPPLPPSPFFWFENELTANIYWRWLQI